MARGLHHPRGMTTYPDRIELTLERIFLQQALAGQDDAFVLLGSMYSEQVYAIARNLCSGDNEALELTRSAFERARKELTGIPDQQSFRTFVCRFLVSEAVERLRSKPPPVSVPLAQFLPRFEDGRRVSASWGWAEIDGLARRRDVIQHIREALAGLQAEDRAAFVLLSVEGLAVDEVAAIMEVPAVRLRAHRACMLLSGYIVHLAGNR